MKQKFLIFILILFMFSLCGCYADSTNKMYDMFNENKENIKKYYEAHSHYSSFVSLSVKDFKDYYKTDNEAFYNFESIIAFADNCIDQLKGSWFDKYIFRCYTNNEAIKLQKLLNIEETYNFDTYTRDGKFVYIDCQISYLFLYGEPLEKEGYLYYELDNGVVDGELPSTYTITSDEITLLNPSKEHYVFTGWTGTNVSTEGRISKGTIGNITVTDNKYEDNNIYGNPGFSYSIKGIKPGVVTIKVEFENDSSM